MPIAQKGDELLSTRYKNDSVKITHKLIEITANGRWGDLGWVTIESEIRNRNNQPITINFEGLELAANFTHGGAPILGVSKAVNENRYEALTDTLIAIGSHEEKRLLLSFRFVPPEGPESEGPSKSLLEKTIRLTVPVVIQQTQEMPVKTDFVFNFRYADQPRFENILGKRLRP